MGYQLGRLSRFVYKHDVLDREGRDSNEKEWITRTWSLLQLACQLGKYSNFDLSDDWSRMDRW